MKTRHTQHLGVLHVFTANPEVGGENVGFQKVAQGVVGSGVESHQVGATAWIKHSDGRVAQCFGGVACDEVKQPRRRQVGGQGMKHSQVGQQIQVAAGGGRVGAQTDVDAAGEHRASGGGDD